MQVIYAGYICRLYMQVIYAGYENNNDKTRFNLGIIHTLRGALFVTRRDLRKGGKLLTPWTGPYVCYR